MAEYKVAEEKIRNEAVKDDTFIWNLDDAVRYLEIAFMNNRNIYISFSGKDLYSFIDDRDSCYKKVTGESYAQFEESLEKEKKGFAFIKDFCPCGIDMGETSFARA